MSQRPFGSRHAPQYVFSFLVIIRRQLVDLQCLFSPEVYISSLQRRVKRIESAMKVDKDSRRKFDEGLKKSKEQIIIGERLDDPTTGKKSLWQGEDPTGGVSVEELALEHYTNEGWKGCVGTFEEASLRTLIYVSRQRSFGEQRAHDHRNPHFFLRGLRRSLIFTNCSFRSASGTSSSPMSTAFSRLLFKLLLLISPPMLSLSVRGPNSKRRRISHIPRS